MIFGFVMLMLTLVGIANHRRISTLIADVWQHVLPLSAGERTVLRWFTLSILVLMALGSIAGIVLSF
jgi:hypothetical protein